MRPGSLDEPWASCHASRKFWSRRSYPNMTYWMRPPPFGALDQALPRAPVGVMRAIPGRTRSPQEGLKCDHPQRHRSGSDGRSRSGRQEAIPGQADRRDRRWHVHRRLHPRHRRHVIGAITLDLDMSLYWEGLIGASALIGIFIGGPLGGWLADKFGRKPLFSDRPGDLHRRFGRCSSSSTRAWQLFAGPVADGHRDRRRLLGRLAAAGRIRARPAARQAAGLLRGRLVRRLHGRLHRSATC